MAKISVVALSLALLPAPALAADQFDLICKGDKETVRYRIDLAAGEWCWEKCEATIKIASATSSRITFMDQDTPSLHATAFVDRASGEWWQSYRNSYSSAYNHGFCTPAPFSGFPAAKF